jgi:DNA primase
MVTTSKAVSYFDTRLGLKKSTNGWYSFECPHCGKSGKGAVHFDYEVVKCWVCGYSNMLLEFIASYEGVSWRDARNLVESCKESDINVSDLIGKGKYIAQITGLELPYSYKPIELSGGTLSRRATEYLVDSRKLDFNYLKSKKIGYCTEKLEKDGKVLEDYSGYIILPFFDNFTSRLRYYIGRDFIGNFLRYKNPDREKCGVCKSSLLYNSECLHSHRDIIIVEGLFCALTLGDNCTATLGKTLSEIQISMILNSPVESVYICLDAGETSASLKMASKLVDHKKVYLLNLKEIAKEGQKDPNDIGKEQVLYLARHTAPSSRLEILQRQWQ